MINMVDHANDLLSGYAEMLMSGPIRKNDDITVILAWEEDGSLFVDAPEWLKKIIYEAYDKDQATKTAIIRYIHLNGGDLRTEPRTKICTRKAVRG